MSDDFSLAAFQSLLETDALGRFALHQRSVASTMDVAREEAESDAPHGLIVLADEQTAGRGRRGRSWVSPPGGLYVTIVLRPEPDAVRRLALVAPLAVCEAIDAVARVRSAIKWPNDVLIEGRKVGGVLIDSRLSGDEVEYALVGIGVNLSLDPAQHAEIRDIATSLALESERKVAREKLLAAVLNRFEKLLADSRVDGDVYEAWRARLETLGRQVRAQSANDVEEGVAEDVDAEGNLLLRRPDGSIAVISAADVTLAGEP
ncbi:MAG: biotin--[acetyl-CoA-carboxylase] ligase [Dehalococcoidia bacterium]|jgi:BirA family biotin operon repressor/biotin-[acetyl-CoA-carboxylase] ligase